MLAHLLLRLLARIAVLLLAVTAITTLTILSAPAAAAVQKGLTDVRLEGTTDPAARAELIDEIGETLGTGWVRVNVYWSTLEATRGTYAASERARLGALVDGLRAAGMKVLLTVERTPTWAQESTWWKRPPPGVAKGPQPFYPVKKTALQDFADLGEFLAEDFRGRVQALECWNEPNLGSHLYPQRTSSLTDYGARSYLSMLRAFHAGVSRAHTGIKVVAGATAPRGVNNSYSTSPQRFASYLKSHGATSLFDVYSHHPYTPGGTSRPAPNQPPADSSTTVTLYNLNTLLRLFPSKPVYLTEYGYNTKYSLFWGLTVSPATQAAYLKQAYGYAGRHKQVKMMVWFLLYDWHAAGTPADQGVYTGLRTSMGERKPSWNAFRSLP